MATLDSLKWALRERVTATASSQKQSLSDIQYSAGFDILVQGSGWMTYRDFIFPQLSQLLDPLFASRTHISVLEIGPGPKSVLGHLPSRLRQKVQRYTAFEPNGLFAARLEEWFRSASMVESPLPCLKSPPDIHRIPFDLEDNKENGASTGIGNGDEKYDVILFCHSMYGLKPKKKYVERALDMLVEQPSGGLVVVFHRDGCLELDDLVCHRTASFPNGVIRVANDDEVLDCFAPYIAGFVLEDVEVDEAIRFEWRKVCRALGRGEEDYPDLLFSSPDIMVAFGKNATSLPELTAQMPLVMEERRIKNREARLHRPASIVRPTEVRHIQQCIRWAQKSGVGLTVLGGSHSGHCMLPNVVSVDMEAFNQVHILTAGQNRGNSGSNYEPGSLVIAEAGCKTGDIVHKTMAAGLTVPLGARPSVGAGLWLQGGIGHLARLHGLACDAIIGAVLVSVKSSQVLFVGHVPIQHRPSGAIRAENESELLWAMKGAGTNFGIVVSVTFRAYAAPTYLIRNWVIPLSDDHEARLKLSDFDELVARKLPQNCSADAYLYWDSDQLHLGVTMLESSTTSLAFATPMPTPVSTILGPEDTSKVVDGEGLFETEMYVSGMHGGHGGGRTSSFKRCLFLKGIGSIRVANRLVAALRTRPSPLCYLHLLQGGRAVGDIAADATAFGCRDWDFACVITGVWPRDQDGTETARSAVRWVYNVSGNLLSLSTGAYGADLGPDPRDTALAAKAFGPNRPRLARLKQHFDPHHVLAYTCPLPDPTVEQKLIILVTGESCAGKDYCAEVWASVFVKCTHKSLTARVVSISDATKREYAATTGADLAQLLSNRAYKEQHRPALTSFFEDQVRLRPQLPEEHFLNVVYGARDVDVLLITGMRDVAPVAAFSHLVPGSRLLEVRVQASGQTRLARQGNHEGDSNGDNNDGVNNQANNNSQKASWNVTSLDYCPSLIFDNDSTGNKAAKWFAEQNLLSFFHEDLLRLNNMVPLIPDFPRPGVEFRHVLNIAQKQGGPCLCTSLLQTHFTGDWDKVDVVVCCEAGGFLFAPVLAERVDVPLVLVREAGKLPPPTISVTKASSYISSLATHGSSEKRIEIGEGVVPRGASVVVVDDVLSTGETLCAILELLSKASIGVEDISIMVVAEFPAHRGRQLLRQRGFSKVNVQSLLVYSGS